MSQELIPLSDVERIAHVMAKSNLFGVKDPVQAMALALIAQAEGKHPATSAQEYHIIQGRPALKADAMLARFQAAGGKVSWTEYTDRRVTGVFSHPLGGSVEVTWTLEMAELANLAKKETWRAFPRAMLRSRCISEGVRTVFPGVAVGILTPEETEVEPYTPPERNVTPPPAAEPVIPPAAPPDIQEAMALQQQANISDQRMKSWLFGATKGRATDIANLNEREISAVIKKLKKTLANLPPEHPVYEGEAEYIPENAA